MKKAACKSKGMKKQMQKNMRYEMGEEPKGSRKPLKRKR